MLDRFCGETAGQVATMDATDGDAKPVTAAGCSLGSKRGTRPTIVDYFSDRPADRLAGHRGGLGLGSAAWEARRPLLADAPDRLHRPADWGCLRHRVFPVLKKHLKQSRISWDVPC